MDCGATAKWLLATKPLNQKQGRRAVPMSLVVFGQEANLQLQPLQELNSGKLPRWSQIFNLGGSEWYTVS